MMIISKATATEYAFVIGSIPSDKNIHAVDELRLNIFNINLPSVSLTQSDMPWQGKIDKMHIGGISFEPLNISFLVDVDFKNWKSMYNWLTFIANNYDVPSKNANEYVTDASLIIYNNFNGINTKIIYKNMWIQSLGELSFSIRDGESHIESTATFVYDRYEILLTDNTADETTYTKGIETSPAVATTETDLSSIIGSVNISSNIEIQETDITNKISNIAPNLVIDESDGTISHSDYGIDEIESDGTISHSDYGIDTPESDGTISHSDYGIDTPESDGTISHSDYGVKYIERDHTGDSPSTFAKRSDIYLLPEPILKTILYYISSSTQGQGSINLSGINYFEKKSSFTYTFTTTAAAWVLSDVEVDGVSVGGLDNYTFEDISTYHTIKGIFTKHCDGTIGFTSNWVHLNFSQDLTVLNPTDGCDYTWEITEGLGTLVNLSEHGLMVTYEAPSTNDNCEYNPIIQLSADDGVKDTLTLSVGITTDGLVDHLSAYGIKVGCFAEGTDPACTPGNYFCCLYDEYGCADEYIGRVSRADGGDPDGCAGSAPGDMGYICGSKADFVDYRTSGEIQAGCCPSALI